MRFSVVLLLSAFTLSVQQQKPQDSSATARCGEFSFDGRVTGGEAFSRNLGEGLRLRLSPTKENWGWIIRVQPGGSSDDYAYPVNPPFHSDNSQWVSTGYGETAEHQLMHDHEVFFVLNRKEYERATKLTDEAMASSDPDAAGRFLAILPSLRSAVLKLKPMKYETLNQGKSVKWMEFSVTVIVPGSFQPAPDMNLRNRACSSNRS